MSRFLFRCGRIRRRRRYRAGQCTPLLERFCITLRSRWRTPFPAPRDDRGVASWVVAALLVFMFVFAAVLPLVLAFVLVIGIVMWRFRHGNASKLAHHARVNAFGVLSSFPGYYAAYANTRFTK
jgi:hypothetical protein